MTLATWLSDFVQGTWSPLLYPLGRVLLGLGGYRLKKEMKAFSQAGSRGWVMHGAASK